MSEAPKSADQPLVLVVDDEPDLLELVSLTLSRMSLRTRTAADNPNPSLFQITDEIERRIIVDMLERSGWNQTEAAERFLIPLSTLNQKIKRLGIDVRRRGRTEDVLSTGIGK